MARNGAGVYSLPVGYLATPGEDILASQHNQPLEDIAAALTGSLPRDGSAGMTGNLAMGSNRITGLAAPVGDNDAARKIDAVLVPASTTVAGAVELATDAETIAGTDATRAVTPAGLASVLAGGAMPAGAVLPFAMNAPPSGWLKANGAAISRTTYAALFSAIGTVYGTGDGSTTFNLPDLRGEFVRGWDDGRSIDASRVFGSSQDSANKAHTHTGMTNSAGAHSHTLDKTDTTGTSGVRVAAGGIGTTSSISTSSAGDHSHTLTIDSSGGTEARPRNIALLYCIKT